MSDIDRVQNQLHVLMAQLADPGEKGDKHVSEEQVEWLENRIDTYQADLPELTEFVLPGGADGGSLLHYARSVARRAERRIVELAENEPVDEQVLVYINRLSDFLFALARYQNHLDDVKERTVDYDR